MCQKSIDRLNHQSFSNVTCGLCEKIDSCRLPAAIQRRRQTYQANHQLFADLDLSREEHHPIHISPVTRKHRI